MTVHDRKPDSAVSKKRGPPRSAMREVAEAAGLSRGQMWRALQVASIPEDEFEARVESDNPPTVTELVRIAGHQHNSKPQGRRLRTCPHCGGDLTADGGQQHRPAQRRRVTA